MALSTRRYGGAYSALAQYWLEYMTAKTTDGDHAPEMSLHSLGSGNSMYEWLVLEGAPPFNAELISAGFEMGLRVAQLFNGDPIACGPQFSAIVGELTLDKPDWIALAYRESPIDVEQMKICNDRMADLEEKVRSLQQLVDAARVKKAAV